MKKTLSPADIVALGFMICAFFLGAGNIIFPPMAGQLAGENLVPALAGFLVTAVGLPLLALLAIARVSGGLPSLGRYLPARLNMALGLAIYLILVPGFGIPRTALVAYEMGMIPFLDSPDAMTLALYSGFYFLVALLFCLRESRLIDYVGKLIAPVLLTLLATIGLTTLLNPAGDLGAASGVYADTPFASGFLDGYMTMDALAALMFGLLIIHTLRAKGIQTGRDEYRYLAIAGVIAASGLALVYLSLFYLGATSHGVTPEPDNGGQIFVAYVGVLMGPVGQYVLACAVTLACLTTAIGGISAFADYVHELNPRLGYQRTVLVVSGVCATVANIGLSQLIALSIPVLVAIYPVAIALILLNLVQDRLRNPVLAFRATLGVAFTFGVLDGLKAAGIPMEGFHYLPLFDQGLAWVLPTLLVLLGSSGRMSGSRVGQASLEVTPD